MMHKAWCSIEEVPYCFPRPSIKFQGHKGQKIDDLDQIWARLLGWSQLSNPSDLPCLPSFKCDDLKLSWYKYIKFSHICQWISWKETKKVLDLYIFALQNWVTFQPYLKCLNQLNCMIQLESHKRCRKYFWSGWFLWYTCYLVPCCHRKNSTSYLLELCMQPTINICAAYKRNTLTHWGRVMHICVSNLTIIGSDNGLSPGRHQAIIWTNAGILLIGPLGTNFSEILIDIITFSLKKMRLKMSSGKWRPFCLALMC